MNPIERLRIIFTTLLLLGASMQMSRSDELDIAIHKGKSDTFVVRWSDQMADKFEKFESIGDTYQGHVFIQYEKRSPLIVTGLKFTYASQINKKTSIRIKFKDQSYVVVVDENDVVFGKEPVVSPKQNK